jgi:hypothetical protein
MYFYLYFVSFKYIGHRSVTMEGNNSPPHKKSRKQIQQVIKLKFLMLYNIIKLINDSNKGRGCKTKGYGHCRFDKVYILPSEKTLDCQYFKELFLNMLLNEDLNILEK